MTELKNKDGLPIRVGQMWSVTKGGLGSIQILCIHGAEVWILSNGEATSVCDNSYLDDCFLVSDPIFGNMSEWRIVTDEEKAKYQMPREGCEVFVQDDWMACNASWYDWCTYRIPRDFRFEDEPKPADKPKREPLKKLEVHRFDSPADKTLGMAINELIDRVNEMEG